MQKLPPSMRESVNFKPSAGTMYGSDAYEEVYSKEGNPREGAPMSKVPSYHRSQGLADRKTRCQLSVSPAFSPVVTSVFLQKGEGSLS